MSRKSDCDDWVVQDWLFKYLDNLWGPHNCDRFAHNYNAKCQNFNSKFWCPGIVEVDTFTVHWWDKNNWLVPPPRLILQVINKLKRETCTGTLVVPEWTSAPFWPMIVDGQSNFRSYIVAQRFFSR